MRILITGGAGFIGSYTALELLRRGHHVTVLDNFLPQVHTADRNNSHTWNIIKNSVELVESDIRDSEKVGRCLAGIEGVLHLAAETGTGQSMYEVARYTSVNVMGTANLLQAIADQRGKIRRFVVASSRAVYGEGLYVCPDHGEQAPVARDVAALSTGSFDPVCATCASPMTPLPTHEDAPLRPASIYASTKLSQEQLSLIACAATGVGVVALRYQNVYGAGQSLYNPYTGILSIFSREMLAGRDIEIFEDGLESRDFVHVEDVARANASALESEVSGRSFNVGSGERTSVNRVVQLLSELLSFKGRTSISGRFRAGDVRHNSADLRRLQAHLGVSPTVPFRAGLEAFVEWARRQLAGERGSNSAYNASLREMADRGLLRDQT